MTSQTVSKAWLINVTSSNVRGRALVCLYNGNPEDSLDSQRYRRFCEKVAEKSSHIKPHALAPTTSTARYHSMWVYMQEQEWTGVSHLQPYDWGWKMSNNVFVPIMIDMPPAPDALLQVIRCSYSTDCMQYCKVHMPQELRSVALHVVNAGAQVAPAQTGETLVITRWVVLLLLMERLIQTKSLLTYLPF